LIRKDMALKSVLRDEFQSKIKSLRYRDACHEFELAALHRDGLQQKLKELDELAEGRRQLRSDLTTAESKVASEYEKLEDIHEQTKILRAKEVQISDELRCLETELEKLDNEGFGISPRESNNSLLPDLILDEGNTNESELPSIREVLAHIYRFSYSTSRRSNPSNQRKKHNRASSYLSSRPLFVSN
jgi:predicted nuclease with TOPRIM domain